MKSFHYVDIHPHIISADEHRYPRVPLFDVQSEWSQERPVTVEQYVAAMDEAGIHQAAIVQASTCYGYDNSYLADSIAKYPGRFTAVGTVDLLAPGCAGDHSQVDRTGRRRPSAVHWRKHKGL